jgi:very-short-patch-repair endonuclease
MGRSKKTYDWKLKPTDPTENPDERRLAYAEHLRSNETIYERRLGRMLKKKLHNVKLWRQTVIRGYILDFYLPDLYLGIELDGKHHDPVKDFRRDRTILQAGVRIMRFPNPTSAIELNSVYSRIYAEIRYQLHRKSPGFQQFPQDSSFLQDTHNLNMELHCWNDERGENVETMLKAKNQNGLSKAKTVEIQEPFVQKGCPLQAFTGIAIAENEVRRLASAGIKAAVERCKTCKMVHVLRMDLTQETTIR